MFKLTNSFSIYKYRKYSGYSVKSYSITGNCDILCVGSCDLSSMRPEHADIFTWAEMLSITKNCDQIGQILPFTTFNNYIGKYLKLCPTPARICFVLPVLAFTSNIGDDVITITENSARVIRFLQNKNIINENKADELIKINRRCIETSQADRLSYFLNQFQILNDILMQYKIELFWCCNGTKTSNTFFRPIINDIIENTRNIGTFVGWNENIDNLPDSSIGIETQRQIFKNFYRYIQ